MRGLSGYDVWKTASPYDDPNLYSSEAEGEWWRAIDEAANRSGEYDDRECSWDDVQAAITEAIDLDPGCDCPECLHYGRRLRRLEGLTERGDD